MIEENLDKCYAASLGWSLNAIDTGYPVIRTPEDADNIPDEEFPALLESHLDGWEFAVEARIKYGKIEMPNISEYVTPGYSVFVPATPELESHRERIT